MLGGVICGYWASGRVQTATPPARVMTSDSTVAKMGLSMKKRENPPHSVVRAVTKPADSGPAAHLLTVAASPALALAARGRSFWRGALGGAAACLGLGIGTRVGTTCIPWRRRCSPLRTT